MAYRDTKTIQNLYYDLRYGEPQKTVKQKRHVQKAMYDVKEWVGAPDGHAISSLDERSDGTPWLGRQNTILHVVIQYASASSGST
ncbi:hypothetical protein F2Q69_00035005 [Brassica cretica]|uniref:Uncharacterized protein n=1 Tax=Brassica cretica TaxID=69181 RepID=A0A8S9SR54_BRACR|nr:hypothetical protein F2Q69_00035005 [Brassica cretica]